jgi:hypothetical protein
MALNSRIMIAAGSRPARCGQRGGSTWDRTWPADSGAVPGISGLADVHHREPAIRDESAVPYAAMEATGPAGWPLPVLDADITPPGETTPTWLSLAGDAGHRPSAQDPARQPCTG